MEKIFLILVLISCQFYAACINDDEKEFLHELLTKNPELADLGWKVDSDIKNWKGLVVKDCTIISLDLYGFNLQDLPNTIFYLKNLEALKLNIGYKKLSRNVFGLQKLRVLHLNGSGVKKFIYLFNRLQNLEELKIVGSYLEEFPEQLLELKKLQYLDFSENNFKKIPKDILKLKNLKYFSLKNNKDLKGEVDVLGPLNKLEYLDVSNTNLYGEYVCTSANLKYLNLSKVSLLKLDVSKTNKLEVLQLKNCNLKEILGFEKQEGLKILNIKDNYISSFKVSKLKSLDSINISKNEFSKVPLFPKKIISYLSIASNPVFDFSTQDFEILDKVISLDISYMALEELPSKIKMLKNCEYLDLSNNKLKKIKLEDLKNLLFLNLRNNNVSEFNFKSKKLKKLDLLNNDFTAIPESVYACENLESLLINNFELREVPQKILTLKKLKELYVPFNGNYDEVLCALSKRGMSLDDYYVKCDK